HPHIPLHFFGVGFYSRLYLLHDETLAPENLSETPHLDLSTGGIYLVRFGEDPTETGIQQLVERWWAEFGQRKARAGQLLQVTNQLSAPLPALDAEPTSHSKAIALGRLLGGLDGQTIVGHTVHARAS